ncbi:hypothetical protein ACKWTF_005598 [Chironomus riparius]
MSSVFELLTIDNPVFKSYGFWSAVLVLKVLAMALVTSSTKRRKSFVINPEDAMFAKGKEIKPDARDTDVERVQRAHQNDLENCIPFLIISFMYMLTNPSAVIATNVIRTAVLSRFAYSYSYINALQPFRSISFGICFASMIYMCINNIMYFF